MKCGMVKLTDVADIKYGCAFDSKSFTDDDSYPQLVRIRDVKRGFSETFYKGEYSRDYVLSAGDLLVGMDGEFNIARWKVDGALLNQRICKIAARPGTYEEYLRFILGKVLKEIEGMTSFATVKHLSAKELNKLELDMPKYEEQIHRSSVLLKVEDIIDKRRLQLDNLDELVRARFVELFEEVKETCNVDYYIKELIAGKSLAGEVECKNKVLKTGAASFDHFDGSQVKNLPINYEPKEEHLVHKGDIIISRMNTAELTGAAAYVWKVSDNVYIPDRLWKAVIRDGVNPIFLWNMLIQPSTKEQIQKVCSGTSGSMKNISKSGMLGIRVKKVDTHLQNDFATFVKQVNKSKLLSVSQPQIHIYKTLTLL